MTKLTRQEQIYFVVICLSAVAILIPGFFAPAGLASGLSWLELPPLHARFVAAIYLFGTITMIAALLLRQWSQIRTVLIMVAIFTGLLFITSILNLQAFDFSKPVVWLWFATYFSYPIIALVLLWFRTRNGDNGTAASGTLPAWIRFYLLLQGVIVGLTAVMLLLFPSAIISLWPWKITPLLAQFYSGPLLAYAVGSVIFPMHSTLRDLNVIVPAMFGFTLATLIASLIHSNLFSFSELPDLLWFMLFGVGTVFLLLISIRSLQAVNKVA